MTIRDTVLESLTRPMTCADVVQATGLGRVQAQNALYQLKAMGKVQVHQGGGKTRYSPANLAGKPMRRVSSVWDLAG